MQPIELAIARAKRRLLMQSGLASLGWAVLVGVAVSAGWLVGSRLMGWGSPIWAYALPVGVAAVVGLGWAWHRRPGREAVATMVDDRCGLKDKLGTALYVGEAQEAHPFAGVIARDAEAAATAAMGPRLKEAFAVRPTGVWGYAAAAAMVWMLLLFLVPEDALGLQAKREALAEAEEQAALAEEEVAQVRAITPEPEAREQVQLPATEEELQQRLDELATLMRQEVSTPQAQAERDEAIERTRDELEQLAEQRQAAQDAMDSALSQLDSENPDSPGREFEEAMRRGDFDAAADALEALGEQAQQGEMTEEERQALEQQMGELADQLGRLAEQMEQQAQALDQQMQDFLQNAGLDEQTTQQLSDGGFDSEAVEQALQDQLESQGMSEQEAQQLAEELNQQLQNMKPQQCQTCENGQQMQQFSGEMEQMQMMLQEMGKPQEGEQGEGGEQMLVLTEAQKDQLGQQMMMMQESLNQMGQNGQKLQQMQMMLNSNVPSQQPTDEFGRGRGGPIQGEENVMEGHQTHSVSDAQNRAGRVLASWQTDGPMTAGESNARFRETVQSGAEQAERAVTEDRVPARYHQTLERYFDQAGSSQSGE